MLNRELKETKNHAESYTRECVALVDEGECLPEELENVREDIRKHKSRVKTQQWSRKVIQRKPEEIKAPSAFNRPPILFELLLS